MPSLIEMLKNIPDINVRKKAAQKNNIPFHLVMDSTVIDVKRNETNDTINEIPVEIQNDMDVLYHIATQDSGMDYVNYFNLQDLTVIGQNLENISVLKGLLNLKALHLDITIGENDDPLQSLDFLKNFDKLTTLTIKNVKLKSLHQLMISKSLKNVTLQGEINEDALQKFKDKRTDINFIFNGI